MRGSRLNFGCLALLLLTIDSAIADSFTGSYTGALDGKQFQLTISGSAGGQYEGELRVDQEIVPLNARRFGDRIAGQIGIAEYSFGFVAEMQAETLLFQAEDGAVIVFRPNRNNAGAASTAGSSSVNSAQRRVYINRVPLDQEVLQVLETQYQLPIADGRYWYDTDTGAWGVEGGPTAGLIYPGLSLPQPMPVDISGGGTGILINGREIHPLDQQALHQLFGVTYQGEFWMNARGDIGYLGGPAIANILQSSQAAQSGEGGSLTHGYDSTYGARGTVGGGMYSGRSATGKSVFWYPGM